MNKTFIPPANDNGSDGLLVIDDHESEVIDVDRLMALTASLRVHDHYYIARADAPERAAPFLARGFNVLVRNGLVLALPDLAIRIRQARRVFFDIHLAGTGADLLGLARDMTARGIRIGLLSSRKAKIPFALWQLASSLTYMDGLTLPQALRR